MTVANLGQIIKARRERMKINQENLAACKAQAEALIAKFPLYPAGAFED